MLSIPKNSDHNDRRYIVASLWKWRTENLASLRNLSTEPPTALRHIPEENSKTLSEIEMAGGVGLRSAAEHQASGFFKLQRGRAASYHGKEVRSCLKIEV